MIREDDLEVCGVGIIFFLSEPTDTTIEIEEKATYLSQSRITQPNLKLHTNF